MLDSAESHDTRPFPAVQAFGVQMQDCLHLHGHLVLVRVPGSASTHMFWIER